MLPTSCVARSYLSFSGAFMALVYSPYAFGEIGVVSCDRLRYRTPEQAQFLPGRGRRQGNLGRGVEIEPRLRAYVALLVRALQAEAALVSLPREQRLARQERLRVAARGDELDLRYESATRMFFAKKDRARHHGIHECGTEGSGEPLAVGAHQVDRAAAVDLRAAEEEGVDPALPRQVEQLARALGERISRAPLLQRDAKTGIENFSQETSGSRNGRRGADRRMARAVQQPRDHAGEVLFPGVRTHSSR